MSTAKLIREGRVRLGLTEQQFADAVGVSRGAVQQWERGTTAPKRNNQAAVARKLGISVPQLMGIDDAPPSAGGTAFVSIEQRPRKAAEPAAAYASLPSPAEEAAELVQSMSPAGQIEALAYLRFMATRHGAQKPQE